MQVAGGEDTFLLVNPRKCPGMHAIEDAVRFAMQLCQAESHMHVSLILYEQSVVHGF